MKENKKLPLFPWLEKAAEEGANPPQRITRHISSKAPENVRGTGGEQGCHLCEWRGYTTRSRGNLAYVERCSCQPVCSKCKGRGGYEIPREDGRYAWKECDCKELERRMALYRSAHIPGKFAEKTIDAFAPTDDSQAKARTYLYELYPRFKPGERGVLLMGSVGTGKTHLAVGFLRVLLLERGIRCKFQDFAEMLSNLRACYARDASEMEVLGPLIETDVLLLDDLGKGRNTKWELQVLDILISGRYNAGRTTLVTTNYTTAPETTLRERFRVKGAGEGDEILSRDTLKDRVGERIYSRLREMCKFFHLQGLDYRQRQ